MADSHSSKEIHDRLDHPVIDADGHYVEFGPAARLHPQRRRPARRRRPSTRPASAWRIRSG